MTPDVQQAPIKLGRRSSGDKDCDLAEGAMGRPAQVDGMADPETRTRLAGLLDQVGGAA
jgi:hypothetical protein